MRILVLLFSLFAFPVMSWAQSTPLTTDDPIQVAPAVPAPLTEAVPRPRLHAEVDAYRVAAIAAGAVAGVVVANVMTGGMITPILVYGTNGGVIAGAGYTHAATQALITAAGALGGGYIGDWLYGN